MTLDKIEIVTPPTKVTYTEGEPFDKTGMVVKATYSDGSSKELGENEYTVAPATALTAADALVTISYGGKTATQQITVNKAQVKTYTLSFDVNGGKERIASQTLAAGATPAAMTAPTRDGYAFAGWKYGETVVDLATFQMPTKDVELVAQWNIITYTIHFSAGKTGASGTAEDMTYQFDGNHDRQKLPSGNDFSLAGHWFVGWSVTVGDKTTIILAGSEITSEIRKALLASENHEITLYMVWKQFAVVTNTITASSGANGSITPSGDVIVEEGEDQTFTIRAASGYEIEEVLVDGVNVRDYDLTALRDAVGIVLQKNLLFSGTIRDNLKWGNPDATEEQLWDACRAAHADEFLNRMPDGLDTDLGQGGVNVSGGQKQRLCIARTLLKHPKVLIFDDSTSAVDTATESGIRRALAELHDVTKLIIAQRISSVQSADLIVILDDGRLHAVGTHAELLANDTIYQEIYHSQMKGGDPDDK